LANSLLKQAFQPSIFAYGLGHFAEILRIIDSKFAKKQIINTFALAGGESPASIID